MKKLFCLILAVLFVTGTAYAWNPVSPGTGNIVQHGGAAWEPGKTFRLVRVTYGDNYNGAIPTDHPVYCVSTGMVMRWITTASGADGITVGPTARSTGDSRVAGVLATDVTISYDGLRTYQYVTEDMDFSDWGYLQTYGKAYTRIGAGVTAGDLVGACFAVTGACAPFDPLNVSVTTAKGTANGVDPARFGILGVALQADAGYTAGDTVAVFVKCE